ncbi:MAG: molybdopterin-dependent oxidoreductase [Candidatus Cloacimonetes bacterium]|nr:molybdopterin-dependent oxidoreductase [Candidatus Cloacimonadota bacterium]
MKKYFILLLFAFHLHSVTILNQNSSIEFDLESTNLTEIEITTEREKEGIVKKDIWQGISLTDILNNLNFKQYQSIVFKSEDNYQIELSAEDIESTKPIIALKLNGEKPRYANRLIVPEKREMYWIQNIATIELLQEDFLVSPVVIYIAESILKTKPIRKELPPFVDVSGYTLYDLLKETDLHTEGVFFMQSSDDISHKLDYQTLLKEAVLVKEDRHYHLRSISFPGGMWTKNLMYLQSDDKAILFRDSCENLSNKLSKFLPQNSNFTVHFENGSVQKSDYQSIFGNLDKIIKIEIH